MIFVFLDVGGVKRVWIYVKYFERLLVICDKYCKCVNEIVGMIVIGDVDGVDVILVDDLVDIVGIFCWVVEILIKKGVKSVKVMCIYLVLLGKVYDNINNF